LLYLLVFLASLRQNSLPGWGLLVAILALLIGRVLQEVPLLEIWAFVKRTALPASVVLFSQVALALFLSAYHTPGRWGLAYGLLLAVALAFLFWQRRRISPAVWLVMLATALFCIRIGSWQYAIVGDEYSFYSMARSFLEHDGSEMWRRLFDGTGVYGTHPFISSILQSFSMAFLGKDNFGWRFSSLYLAAASVYFFYSFFKTFLNQRIALTAAFLLAVSQYLMNFSKIGYNNLQALFVQGLALWAIGHALKNQRPLAFTLAGAALGLCFYVYPAALYAAPLPILLALFYLPPRSRPSLLRWGQLLLGLALFLLPLIIQPVYWQTKLAGTSFNNPDINASAGNLVFHYASNLLYALFAYGYAVDQTHFVVSSYLDALSAVFVPLGMGLLLPALRRQRFALFVVLAFMIELVLVGASHDRSTPSTTRMFMLLPWLALFAAAGIEWIVAQVSPLFTGKHGAHLALAIVLTLVGVINLYHAYPITRQTTTGTPNLELLFLRLLQADQRADPGYPKSYLFITQPDWGIDGIRVLQDVYDVPGSQAQLLHLSISTPGLPEAARLRIQEESMLVIVQPWMADDLRQQVETELSTLGKLPCPVSDTPLTEPRFTLWHAPALQNICHIANTP
jgi:4-amino-4-deoxy-L-arabinose transferase-like glycosyltransferase